MKISVDAGDGDITRRYSEIEYSPIKDSWGAIVGVLVIVHDVTEKKKAMERLASLNQCFLSFGPDPEENINLLVALCGSELGATCALYSRLQEGLLCSMGRWNTPSDLSPRTYLKATSATI